MRADRLVSLVLLLQARGRMTAADLAAELTVSVRTVYRDLAALNAAGVPVYAESGPHGGCQLVAGYRFPLRGLRPEEAEALLILGVPQALRELGLDSAAMTAQHQIRVTAGLDGPGDPQPATALVHLDMPQWFRSQEPVPQLQALAAALRQGRRLELRYARAATAVPPAPKAGPGPAESRSAPAGAGAGRAPAGARRAPAARTVSPLGLVNKAGVWYLVAAAKSGRITVFRVGRIGSARMLAEAADRPAGFDLAACWAQWSQEFTASRPRLPVTLRASPLALAILPEVFGDQVREAVAAAGPPAADGWRELTLTFEHEQAAAHRLAGFGPDVEVISPAAVRDGLVRTARGILGRYPASRD